MIAIVVNHGFGQDIFDLIGKSAVFLFFFLSAYFVPSSGRKIVNRMVALAISYFLWNLIYGAVEYIFIQEMPPATFVGRFFGEGKPPFNPPFWFLRDLILFHAVWYLLQWAGRHVSWLIAACLIACWIEPFRDVSYTRQTCPYWMTPFLLGLLCRTMSVARLERCLHPGVALPAAVLFAWCAVHYERGLHPAAWMSMAACGALTLAAAAFYALRFEGCRKALYFVLPPPCVFFIYALHSKPILVLYGISDRISGWFAIRYMPEQLSLLTWAGRVLALLVLTFALCQIFYAMRRWTPALLKPLNAGRLPRSTAIATDIEKPDAPNSLNVDCAVR